MADKSPGFLSLAKDVSLLVAIYLYFTGWIYMYYYFAYFGLSIRQLDIEFYFFFIYSVNIFIYLIREVWILAIFLTIVAGILVLRERYQPVINSNTVRYFLLAITFPALFFLARVAAINDGKAQWIRPNLPLVIFEFKSDFIRDTIPKDNAADSESVKNVIPNYYQKQFLVTSNFERQLHLLSANKEKYWVFLQKSKDDNRPQVYEIFKESVQFIHVSQQ